jgi:cysteine desulfurase
MAYLDYNATTPLAPCALAAMVPVLEQEFGNPSSIHAHGRRARAVLDNSRDSIAALLGVRPHEIIFTGGGTESDNLAILGLARSRRALGKHLITVSTEHHAVLHAFEFLGKSEGFEVTVLPVTRDGQLDPEQLQSALRPDTILVSVMSANNETGVIQPMSELAAICRSHGVPLHSDMVQSFGKQTVKPGEIGISALSIAAHKFYGPKGAGILYLEAGQSLAPLHLGGSHENQRRPGTEDVANIAGMAAAAEWVQDGMESEQRRQNSLRESLWDGISRVFPASIRNGNPELTLANTLNVTFPGVDGETLLIGLDLEGVSVSSGSACMVGSVQPSHVLIAMGVDPAMAKSTVRFSLGKPTKASDVEAALAGLSRVLSRQTPKTSTADQL